MSQKRVRKWPDSLPPSYTIGLQQEIIPSAIHTPLSGPHLPLQPQPAAPVTPHMMMMSSSGIPSHHQSTLALQERHGSREGVDGGAPGGIMGGFGSGGGGGGGGGSKGEGSFCSTSYADHERKTLLDFADETTMHGAR
ncbi:uncharacterized protein LOC142338439 [Convolutriloba macropyga]|uniref:uncharacterized protein LOC142338439 n=1 Tax=Convolutriloba macropyga TaxID=536237 RepID=UPI003F51DEB0